ncbi:MAG: M56 family metallopeptidase [Dysgonamonadaceae bacterium]|jgi:TonB family protein|nr:M56 family metallopeptidase [Dysgonamonadaceae bacterium]
MDFLTYLIKVNVAVALFYGCYRLLFREDTFLKGRRVALLGLILTAVVYPFVDVARGLANSREVWEGILPVYTVPEVAIFVPVGGQSVSFVDRLPELFLVLYGVAVAGLFVWILIQAGIIAGWVSRSQTVEMYGITVHRHPGIQTPFSFFRWIVLDTTRYTDVELQEILRHENTHVREAHSVDILLAELLCTFCWFNPFAWLLKREIRLNLEFLADRSVLASGCEAEHYQFHLLRLTYHKAIAKIINNFNVSLLKKRIFMMNKKQTSKLSIVKYTLLIPVIAALVFFNNTFRMQAGNVPSAIEENETPAMLAQNLVVLPATNGEVAAVASTSKDSIFSDTEKMPSFPGGEEALMKYLSTNLHYPRSAAQKGIEGRVSVRFVVASDGSIVDTKIQHSLNPACDQEAIRVIESMPKWTPGMKDGKAVSVYYTLSVRYKLPAPKKDNVSPQK